VKTINVTVIPETKIFTSMGKTYISSYPNGYPINVRNPWHCNNCGVEVGGHFGNKVYGDKSQGLCNGCIEKDDPIVQLCIAQTGMTPNEYQRRHGVAWNE